MNYSDTILVTATSTLVVLAIHFGVTLRRGRPRVELRRSWVSGLLTAGVALSVATLTATAFWGTVRGEVEGWTLFVHLAAAGPFVVLVTLFSVWGVRRSQARGWLARAAFVAILVATLGTLGTIVVSMRPIFGSEALLEVFELHRLFGLALALCTLVYVYAVMVEKKRRNPAAKG